MRDGSDVTLVGCGIMVSRCLQAAEALAKEKVSARVINLSTVKPLDVAMLDKAARETGGIVTAEEHTVVHGIGGAVASAVVENHPVPMAFVGVQDVFGESGTDEELFAKYGLTASQVVEAARGVLQRRGR